MIGGTRADERPIFESGTDEVPPAARALQVGNISAVVDSGALRQLCLGSVELVRQIDFPIRDANWATYQPESVSETVEQRGDQVLYQRQFEVDGGALQCRVVIELNASGVVTAVGEATATRPFATNRSGFTILHPVAGFAGRPVIVTSPTGHQRQTTMPDTISPGQPIKNIAGLAFEIDGVALDFSFTGDVFEMEDQRNWSDASFKTYCRPLTEPFTFEIPAGSTIRQEIRITCDGIPASNAGAIGSTIEIGEVLERPIPDLLLAADDGWLPKPAQRTLLDGAGLRSLLLRVTPSTADSLLDEARKTLEATGGALNLEIVLKDDAPCAAQVEAVATACERVGVSPTHVIALPEAFLESHQPDGSWPTLLQPEDAIAATRSAFPRSLTGAGMLTNFTELNRCRPNRNGPTAADFITHGNSATVHASDDASVMQTLEALPDIFRTAEEIDNETGDSISESTARPYRLGLTAIGMRTNPYGSDVTANHHQNRLTMTTWDPRARGLFGAAWTIGVLAATEQSAIEAIALAAPVGPFGMLASRGPVGRAWYDDNDQAIVYPIFHALTAAAQMPERRHRVSGLGPGMAAIAASDDSELRLIVANLNDHPNEFTFLQPGSVATLDTTSFEAAVADPEWLTNAAVPLASPTISLDRLALAFITSPSGVKLHD